MGLTDLDEPSAVGAHLEISGSYICSATTNLNGDVYRIQHPNPPAGCAGCMA